MTGRRWFLPLIGLLAIFAAGAVWTRVSNEVERTLLSTRFTAARFSGQAAWTPCTERSEGYITRSVCAPLPSPESPEFARLARVATITRDDAADRDADTRALWRRALFELRWATVTPASIRRAVELLERAVHATPGDPALLNDLAVGYLAEAERSQELDPLLRALDAVERSLSYDARSPSALFNRALLLERIHLTDGAVQAWNTYLAADSRSSWADEARNHLRRLSAPGGAPSLGGLTDSLDQVTLTNVGDIGARVRAAPQFAREVSFRLLGRWGAAVLTGDQARASELMDVVRAIAASLDSMRADRSIALAVAAIDAGGGSAARRHALAVAHERFAAGLAEYGRGANEVAAVALGESAGAFERVNSPMHRWARFYLAASRIDVGNYGAADSLFNGVLAGVTADEPALEGKIIWALGVTQLRRGNYDSANRLYRRASPLIERTGEGENRGAIAYLLSEGFALAGQTAQARAEMLRGLSMLSPYRRSTFLNNHLAQVAALARAEHLPHAALDFMDEVIAVAHAAGAPQTIAWAYRSRAANHIVLNQSEAARADLREARKSIDRLRPGRVRDRVIADVALVESRLARAADPKSALPALEGVLATYRAARTELTLIPALHEAASTALAAQNRELARQWLVEAADQIERQRSTFTSADARATFTEAVDGVFDDLAELAMDAGQSDSALAYVERGRAALWRAAGTSAPPDVRALARRIPQGTVVVEYALFATRLAIWTGTATGWRSRVVSIKRDSVAALVTDLLQGLDVVEAGPGSSRARLFDLLLRPFAAELRGASRVLVVPDRELNLLPFPALWASDTRRYVIEEAEFRILPSLALLDHAPEHSVIGNGRALVVGEPRTDTSATLPPLPGAAREAARVAALYRNATLLTGVTADRDHLLSGMRSASIFHFAGHAIADADRPERSYLALAANPTRPDESLLRAEEIGELRLSNLGMVILSACSTINPRPSRVGPIGGFAYSFLRAGVPATIGTLWDVSDATTTDLLVAMHQRIAGGATPADALRQAQIAALHSTDGRLRAPRAWAAFVYAGF